MKYPHLKYELAKLDWIKILKDAIESRPTSWGTDIVREWRNAGDEVYSALITALEEKGLVPTFEQIVKKDQHEEKKS